MWELSAELVVITVEELEGGRANTVYPFLVCGASSDGTHPFWWGTVNVLKGLFKKNNFQPN